MWAKSSEAPESYAPGSSGPSCADELIRRDGREWHELGAATRNPDPK